MVNRPSVPEVITVNSEQLQQVIRDLLPSQNGFGSELQASNVITPIIDLTAAAEGSGLPNNLQTALSFGSQTTFNVNATTTTVVSQTGFWNIIGNLNMDLDTTGAVFGAIFINDGTSDKQIFGPAATPAATPDQYMVVPFNFTIFLAAGHSIKITTSTNAQAIGSLRQLATGDGTLVSPNGFPL